MLTYRVTYPFKVPHGASQHKAFDAGSVISADDIASWIGEDGKPLGDAKRDELVASGHLVEVAAEKPAPTAEAAIYIPPSEPKRSRF